MPTKDRKQVIERIDKLRALEASDKAGEAAAAAAKVHELSQAYDISIDEIETGREKKGGRRRADDRSGCVHYWHIQPAEGPISLGCCRKCGRVREFENYPSGKKGREDGAATVASLPGEASGFVTVPGIHSSLPV